MAQSPADTSQNYYAPAYPSEDARTVLFNQVAWGAVFAGVVISLAVQLILNMLGVGIGASTIDPLGGDNPSASSFGMGAAIWWTVSGIVAAFAGGHVAGRLAGKPRQSTNAWHGLVAWAMATLVVFYLLSTAVGGLIGGAYRTVAGAMGGMAQVAGGAAKAAGPILEQVGDPFQKIEREMRSASTGEQAVSWDAAVAAMRAVVDGDPAQAQVALERAAQAMASAQEIPVEQAREKVQAYAQQYRVAVDQAKQKATEAADATARAVSRGALFGALALILGAVAGWFGGRTGTIETARTANAVR